MAHNLIMCSVLLIPQLCGAAERADIILGQVTSISSPLVGEISKELTLGYQIYFDKINAQGGINGRKIRLLQKDDGYDAKKMVALTRELIEKDNAIALVGYLGTPGPTLIVKEHLLIDHNIALIGPSTGVAKLLREPNIFPVRATYEAELGEIVAHSKAMQRKKVAVVTWNAGAGPLLAEAWPAMIASAGLDLVYRHSFDVAANDVMMQGNIDAAIMPIAATKPDAVFLIAGGKALHMAVREIRQLLPPTTSIYAISSVNWRDLIKNVGIANARGIVVSQCVPYPYSPQLPIVKNYAADVKAAGKGATVNYYGLEGYLGAVVTVEALKRASPDLTRANVTSALNKAGRLELSGFEVNYTQASRTGFMKPDITLITSQGTLVH